MAKIGIVGSGSWGIALAVLLYNNGHSVSVWSALPEEITEMKTTGRHHTLPDLVLPDGMMFTESLEEVMEDKAVLVTAVPSVYVRSTAQKMKPYCREGQIIVNVAKGIEESTLKTLSEILEDELPMAEMCIRDRDCVRPRLWSSPAAYRTYPYRHSSCWPDRQRGPWRPHPG